MAKKKIKPSQQKLMAWIDARKRHRLSHAQIQMARELGMNPKKFGRLDNHRQEPWKMPPGKCRSRTLSSTSHYCPVNASRTGGN